MLTPSESWGADGDECPRGSTAAVGLLAPAAQLRRGGLEIPPWVMLDCADTRC